MLALVLLLLSTASQAPAAGPCDARKPSGIEAFVVMTPERVPPRDTIARVAVCIAGAGLTAKRIGSYHGELTFDSTAARVVSVEKPKDGMRVDNARRAGSVRFAGAAPEGFAGAAFVTVTLRLAKPGTRPGVRLRMLELNATDGANLLTQLVTEAERRP